jgi:hypothetical protein
LFPEARMRPLSGFPPSMTRACGAVVTDMPGQDSRALGAALYLRASLAISLANASGMRYQPPGRASTRREATTFSPACSNRQGVPAGHTTRTPIQCALADGIGAGGK